MHGFWVAAEAGLDAWAARHPADADDVSWPRRRRAALFAADLRALGGDGTAAAASCPRRPGAALFAAGLRALGGNGTAEPPRLPAIADTDQALGRLYVL